MKPFPYNPTHLDVSEEFLEGRENMFLVGLTPGPNELTVCLAKIVDDHYEMIGDQAITIRWNEDGFGRHPSWDTDLYEWLVKMNGIDM